MRASARRPDGAARLDARHRSRLGGGRDAQYSRPPGRVNTAPTPGGARRFPERGAPPRGSVGILTACRALAHPDRRGSAPSSPSRWRSRSGPGAQPPPRTGPWSPVPIAPGRAARARSDRARAESRASRSRRWWRSGSDAARSGATRRPKSGPDLEQPGSSAVPLVAPRKASEGAQRAAGERSHIDPARQPLQWWWRAALSRAMRASARALPQPKGRRLA